MPAGLSAWTPLANLTLGSAAASITFSSISGLYRDLVFVYTQPSSGTQVRPLIQANNDTSSANYFEVVATGAAGNTTSSVAYSNTGFDPVNRYASYTNPGQITIQFMDYSATDKHKSVLYRSDDATQYPIMGAGRWANTGAIIQIRFLGSGGNNLPAGTSVALYGVSF